jgi:hypothetical protein
MAGVAENLWFFVVFRSFVLVKRGSDKEIGKKLPSQSAGISARQGRRRRLRATSDQENDRKHEATPGLAVTQVPTKTVNQSGFPDI